MRGGDQFLIPDVCVNASKVVLPRRRGIRRRDVRAAKDRAGQKRFCEAAQKGKPCLGVCLGLQLLFDISHEDGEHAGLGLLPGRVVRFPPRPGLKVPHMGWNTLRVLRPAPLLAGVGREPVGLLCPLVLCSAAHREDVAAESDYPSRSPRSSVRQSDCLPVSSGEEPGDWTGDVC